MKSNRPQKGSLTGVEPIRSQEAIERIKGLLAQCPRDFLLFVLGINTNLRACDLLALLVGAVRYLQVGQTLVVRERKTGKLRRITFNRAVVEAIQAWLAVRPDLDDASPLFPSRKGGKPLCVSTLNRMVKRWCREAGLKENHGCHTLRKTFGYIHRTVFRTDVPTLMVLFNHSSQRQTLEYLGIQEEDMARAYLKEI
jgi:integrase